MTVKDASERGKKSRPSGRKSGAILATPEALQHSEQRFQNLFDSSPDAIFVEDTSGRVLDANPAACRLHGLSREELVGKNVLDLVPPEERSRVARDFAKQAVDEQDYIEGFSWTADGRAVPVEIRCSPIHYQDQPAVLFHVRDVSYRRQVEQHLRRQTEILQNIFDHIPLMIALCHPDGRATFANRQMTLQLDGNLEAIQEIYRAVRQTAATEAESPGDPGDPPHWTDQRLQIPNGGILDASWTIVGLSGGESLLIGRDLTARHQALEERQVLREQLVEAQKMESIATLAGGVAHDFNNILSVMFLSVEMLRDKLPDPDAPDEDFAELQTSLSRASALVRQLLLFARRQTPERRPGDLNRVLSDLMKMLTRIIGEDVQLELTMEPDLPSLLFDPSQMEQVMMNLAVNARDAMPNGGVLTVSTRSVVLDSDYSRGRPAVKSGRFVQWSVADSGIGMDAETQRRIFEPFFTTKEVGRGTGIGLAVVHGIISQHEGFIRVTSRAGVGTTFDIFLPVPDGAAQEAIPEIADSVIGGTETILVVEDAQGLREMTRRALTKIGYTVLTAADGEEALELLAARRGKIDLALLDLVMPHLGGREVYRRMRERGDLTPVLFTTGYKEQAGKQAPSLPPILLKPYTVEQLAARCRAALRGAHRQTG